MGVGGSAPRSEGSKGKSPSHGPRYILPNLSGTIWDKFRKFLYSTTNGSFYQTQFLSNTLSFICSFFCPNKQTYPFLIVERNNILVIVTNILGHCIIRIYHCVLPIRWLISCYFVHVFYALNKVVIFLVFVIKKNTTTWCSRKQNGELDTHINMMESTMCYKAYVLIYITILYSF